MIKTVAKYIRVSSMFGIPLLTNELVCLVLCLDYSQPYIKKSPYPIHLLPLTPRRHEQFAVHTRLPDIPYISDVRLRPEGIPNLVILV